LVNVEKKHFTLNVDVVEEEPTTLRRNGVPLAVTENQPKSSVIRGKLKMYMVCD
jgi:hypothetical protein